MFTENTEKKITRPEGLSDKCVINIALKGK